MNPQKEMDKIKLKSSHRVVLVVFIPKLEGYYLTIFDVLKLSIESLLATNNKFCEVTIVNNGSCEIVSEYLNNMYLDGRIDCLIHHKENIGKIDAMIGAARLSREELITLSDTDILFVKGWQQNIEKVFNSFKGVGSVSPIPVRKAFTYGTYSTLTKIILRKVKFSYEEIKENFISHNRFLESINWEVEHNDTLKWPVVEANGVKAIVGSSHQIVTIRRSMLFDFVPKMPSFTLVGNNSEYDYVDLPIDLSGKMRLATYNNFAFHMGNRVEEWMYSIQTENLKNKEIYRDETDLKMEYSYKKSPDLVIFCYRLKKKIIKRCFMNFLKSGQ